MAEPLAIQGTQTTVETEDSLLEKIFKEGRLAPTEEERGVAKEWVAALVDQVLTKEMKISSDTEAMLNARIAAIDQAARKLVVTAETDRLLVQDFARRLTGDHSKEGQN